MTASYSEVLDVSSPSVWCPENHEEFSLLFRRGVRQLLLAANYHRRFNSTSPLTLFAVEGLQLPEVEDIEYLGGVAWASSTNVPDVPSDQLAMYPVEKFVLYTVSSEGKVSHPDSETLPFLSPDGCMPPSVTCPQRHRDYLSRVQVQEIVCMYPELFCPESRLRLLVKARKRYFQKLRRSNDVALDLDPLDLDPLDLDPDVALDLDPLDPNPDIDMNMDGEGNIPEADMNEDNDFEVDEYYQ